MRLRRHFGDTARSTRRGRATPASIVAAGTVIPEKTVIEPNSLVVGVPGKTRRKLGPEDEQMILRYARNYLDYTQTYLNERRLKTENPG